MAIVLRGFMARFRDHPEELASTVPAGASLPSSATLPSPKMRRVRISNWNGIR